MAASALLVEPEDNVEYTSEVPDEGTDEYEKVFERYRGLKSKVIRKEEKLTELRTAYEEVYKLRMGLIKLPCFIGGICVNQDLDTAKRSLDKKRDKLLDDLDLLKKECKRTKLILRKLNMEMTAKKSNIPQDDTEEWSLQI